MAIVKANYQARQSGKAAKAMGRACKYYTYREGGDQAQRQWRGADGQALSYEQARTAIREGAQTYGYSYRITLSTKEADIGAEGYQQILAGRFEQAYFVEHRNTAYPHAHVIAFTKQVIKKAELKEIRGQLAELERTKARELGQGWEASRQAEPAPSVRGRDLELDR